MGEPGSAWKAADAAATDAGVSLVPMTSVEDAVRINGVIARVWGEDELRPSLTRAFEHAGCGVYGAEDERGSLVGFVLGFLGWDGGLHMHSHMLAVLPDWRARGVGHALKLAQRAACLDAGVSEARWTYDPLVVPNAWFNLVKLGTVATAFFPGFYGEMTDRINQGDRSDRFEVRWRLGSDRVDRAVSGGSTEPARGPVLLSRSGDEELPRPNATGLAPQPGAMIEVPVDHAALRARDRGLSREWRDASAAVFESCFQSGLVGAWMDREGRYVFRSAEEVMD